MKEYFNAWNYVFDGLPSPFWKLIKKFSDLKYGWEKADHDGLKEAGIAEEYITKYINLKKTLDPLEEINRLNKQGIKVLTSRDKTYPKQLIYLNNYLSPFVLYLKGNLNPDSELSIGVVGTRNMTGYGESVARQIISDLAPYNPVIISGMADGIDSTAHRAAIENRLKTVAVLGFGLNRIPFHKQKFAQEIMNNGAVISEYPPDSKAEKFYFPLRNRIIAGLSKAVVVIEAGEKSGALITARCANDQGREVFAVPGNLGNEKSIGTNRLIRDTGVNILTCAEDIIIHYKMPVINKIHSRVFSEKQKLLINRLKKSPCSKEDFMQMNLFSAGELNAALTEFELKSIVNKNIEGRYYLTL